MARLLLDTHTVLWWLTDPEKLRRDAFQSIESEQNEVFVSAVSVWEIAVKRALGRLKAPDDLEG